MKERVCIKNAHPLSTFEDVLTWHAREVIPPLEWGKPRQFLPRHVGSVCLRLSE